MKKLFILGAGLVATMMFMTSCSNEEEETTSPIRTEETQKEELQNLKMSITKLNEQWELRQENLRTRTIINTQPTVGKATVKTSRNIARTDLAGATIGIVWGPWWGLTYAAVFSAIAYAESTQLIATKRINMDSYNTTKRLFFVQDGNTPTRMDSIGYYHNLILQRIGTDKLANANFDTVEQLVVQSMKDIFGEDAKCITLAELRNNEDYKYVKSNIGKLSTAQNVNGYCNILAKCKSISQAELDVLKEYMIGLESKDNANGEYTLEVLNTLNSSNLEAATKDRIKAGIIVGNASQKLWVAK